MPSLSRSAMVVAGVGVLAMSIVFVACGLDESGIVGTDASVLDVSVDTQVPDVVADTQPSPDVAADNVVPPQEGGAEASCFDASVPDGWVALGVKVEAGVTCPGSGVFNQVTYYTNPTLDPGACQCGGCTPSGSWSCDNGTFHTGQNCGTATTVTGTTCTSINANHFGATIQRSGTVTCGAAAQTGNQDAGGTAVNGCVPNTTAPSSFCTLSNQGFGLCIYNTNVSDGGCPPGFPNATVVGTPSASCNACSCTFNNADAGCTGTVSVYGGNNCNGTAMATTAADGSCPNTNGYQNIQLAPDPAPPPDCQPSAGGGTAVLSNPLTICCP